MNSTPASMQAAERSRVAVAACPTYSSVDVAAALAEVMAAVGGLAAFVKTGQTVLIKPNLFSPHSPEDAVTTHPELVRQVILLCVEAGAGRIWVGDSPVGMQTESDLWSHTGMTAAVAGTIAELKSWQTRQIPLTCGIDLLAVPEWYPQVDVVISLAKLKTHCLTTMTCGLKNVYGIVSGMAKSQFHMKYSSPLAMSAFLVRVFAVLKPQLTIADAIMAMEGNGPAHGQPMPVGVLLASRDAVALDAVGCMALRIRPAEVPMIRLAAAEKLGCMEETGIDCVGSGVTRLQTTRMKPSLARFLRYIPESIFGLTPRFFNLRPAIQKRHCTKCGSCSDVCPSTVIQPHGRNGYPVIDQKGCIACFCCLESCSHGAIALRLYLGTTLWVAQQKRRRVVP